MAGPPGTSERILNLPGRGAALVREVAGPPNAPVLLLLHGLTATALLNWSTSLVALGHGFRVLALDQRGHGRGIRQIGRFRLEHCADDAAALADLLGLERVIPVGYSMGGAVAQLFWRRHPQRTAGLVLCATSYRFGGERAQKAAAALGPLLSFATRVAPTSLWEGLSERMLAGVADERLRRVLESELSNNQPTAIVEAAAALARFDSSPWLGEVSAPAAVVVTMEDQHIAPQVQHRLAAQIPAATVHTVQANHYACVSRPDLFVPALIEACRSVALRAEPVRVLH